MPSIRSLKWVDRGAPPPAPHNVKTAVLARHGLVGAVWIETGTHMGDTTAFLATDASLSAKAVISLEPSTKYFQASQNRLAHLPNVELVNSTSEECLSRITQGLEGPVCFWLDGHYSSGDTFAGQRDTPILLELGVIAAELQSLCPVRVFVDDVRLFVHQHRETSDPERSGYPSLSALADWATTNGLGWTIEHDIFIAWLD